MGELVTENETDTNQTDTKEAYGTRFTHTIQVAHYFGWGTTDYHGYFTPNSTYNTFEKFNPSGLTPDTILGQTIEFLANQAGNTIFRTLNGANHAILVNYEITVNGKTCPFKYNDPNLAPENTIIIANCELFENLAGQTVKVDISPKQ